jgi:uncharacterized RDD family membrane protein YckC
MVDAGFARRLAAFAVDACIVFGLSVAFLAASIIHAVGRLPVSARELDLAFSALDDRLFFEYAPLIAYVVWSWTPLSGRRSLGKRAFGLRVIRE